MTRHRSQAEIFVTILEATLDGGVTASELLSKANLSSARMKRYVDSLLEREFLVSIKQQTSGRQIFKITERGRKFLSSLNHLDLTRESLPEQMK
jgi:predicted transcriptional regulator